MLVGDDLFVTNPKYLQKGYDMKAGNAILIKPNQIRIIQFIKIFYDYSISTFRWAHRSRR